MLSIYINLRKLCLLFVWGFYHSLLKETNFKHTHIQYYETNPSTELIAET